MIAKWVQEDVETLDNLLNNNNIYITFLPTNSFHKMNVALNNVFDLCESVFTSGRQKEANSSQN